MSLRRFLPVLLVSAVALFVPTLLSAQSQEAPKYEVFGGYSWYHAGGSVPSTVVGETVISGGAVQNFNKGWAGQFTYNLNHWVGLAVDANGHYGDFGNAHSVTFGPQFRLRGERFTPFAEALLGWQRIGPKLYPDQDTAAFILGGGLDYSVTPRFSIRPFQVDYVNAHYNKLSLTGDASTFNGVRVQAGLVWKLSLPAVEGRVSAACSAEPAVLDAGVPVKIGVTPAGFLPKRELSYSYASNGGKVAGSTNTATVFTAGLEPGSYTVTAKVIDNGKGKHQQVANCQATFSVNEPPKHPPVLSVTANPASVASGDSSTITASGSSPDNRPLSYKCAATAGRLNGNGPAYTLDTAGVPESSVSVRCTVSDDRNLTASASTAVKVDVPPPALLAKDFGLVGFKHDLKRPTRVDNEAKGELDRYADALASAPDAKGVIVGYASVTEDTAKKSSKKSPQFAAQRAVNTKNYVTKEKGIDPTRIEVRTGSGDDQKIELWIVPVGAALPATDTKVVDESKVKAVPRVALRARKAAHKRAHKKAHKKILQS